MWWNGKAVRKGSRAGGPRPFLWQVCIQNEFKWAGEGVNFRTENQYGAMEIIAAAQPLSERLSQPQKMMNKGPNGRRLAARSAPACGSGLHHLVRINTEIM